jgi:hypothetical protein
MRCQCFAEMKGIVLFARSRAERPYDEEVVGVFEQERIHRQCTEDTIARFAREQLERLYGKAVFVALANTQAHRLYSQAIDVVGSLFGDFTCEDTRAPESLHQNEEHEATMDPRSMDDDPRHEPLLDLTVIYALPVSCEGNLSEARAPQLVRTPSTKNRLSAKYWNALLTRSRSGEFEEGSNGLNMRRRRAKSARALLREQEVMECIPRNASVPRMSVPSRYKT